MAPIPTTMRWPHELREQVDGLAKRERRTFTAQVLILVEAGLRVQGILPRRESEVLDEMRDRLDAREVVTPA